MSFGGHVAAMISSLRNNARPKRKRFFDKKIYYTQKGEAFDKKATPEQLEEQHRKLMEEKRKSHYKQLLALIISVIALALLLWYMLWGRMF